MYNHQIIGFSDYVESFNINYLEEMLGDVTETQNIVIDMVRIDDTNFIGAHMKLENSAFTGAVSDINTSFYQINTEGVLTHLFNHNADILEYPTNMQYVNGKLYVLMSPSETFSFNSDDFFSGGLKIYSYNLDGTKNWERNTSLYTMASQASYRGAMDYDPTGYLILGGSTLGAFVPQMGVNLMPTYNLTKKQTLVQLYGIYKCQIMVTL